jgi:DNA-binding NarL/FixJ family response regulator
MRILIVDALSHTRENLKTFLELHDGMEVVGEVATGADALRFAHTHASDIVIMDVNLPDMDSLEVTRQLVASGTELTVILLTIHSEGVDFQAAYEAGAQVCIAKSDGAELIIDAVRAEAVRRQDRNEN